MEPTITTENGGRQRWTRSPAIIVAYLDPADGDIVAIDDQPDEYMPEQPEANR